MTKYERTLKLLKETLNYLQTEKQYSRTQCVSQRDIKIFCKNFTKKSIKRKKQFLNLEKLFPKNSRRLKTATQFELFEKLDTKIHPKSRSISKQNLFPSSKSGIEIKIKMPRTCNSHFFQTSERRTLQKKLRKDMPPVGHYSPSHVLVSKKIMIADFKTTRRNVEKNWLINHDIYDKFPFFTNKKLDCTKCKNISELIKRNKNKNNNSKNERTFTSVFGNQIKSYQHFNKQTPRKPLNSLQENCSTDFYDYKIIPNLKSNIDLRKQKCRSELFKTSQYNFMYDPNLNSIYPKASKILLKPFPKVSRIISKFKV